MTTSARIFLTALGAFIVMRFIYSRCNHAGIAWMLGSWWIPLTCLAFVTACASGLYWIWQ